MEVELLADALVAFRNGGEEEPEMVEHAAQSIAAALVALRSLLSRG